MHSNIVVPGSFTSLHTHDTVGNMGVMICFSQGGLHSLSASSLFLRLGKIYVKHLKVTFVAKVVIIELLIKSKVDPGKSVTTESFAPT